MSTIGHEHETIRVEQMKTTLQACLDRFGGGRLYLDSSRYIYLDGSTLKFYDGSTAKTIYTY